MAIGRPITETPNIADKIVSTLATAGQTEFTVTGGYRVNHLAVFRNGVRLVTGRDYIAGDGLTVELLEDAALNDVLEFQVFDTFSISDAIVGNSTSQTLTGDLTVNGTFTVGANGIGTMVINTMDVGIITSRTGIVTFNNTTASTSSSTGAAQFKGGVGIAKSLFVAGNISAGGTLTYEDVTNVDSVGIVTAGKGVRVTTEGLVVTTGVSTFNGAIDANERVNVGSGTLDSIGLAAYNDSTVAGRATIYAENDQTSGNLFLGYGGGALKATITGTGDATFVGDVSANDVSIADKIIHTGDTNTAIRFPSADTITAETAGSERMKITSNGGILLSNGILVERCKIVTTAWSTTNDISLDDGNVFLNTANLGGTGTTIDITSSNGLDTDLAVGDMTSVTLITAVNATTAFINEITIGASAVTESWVGGSAPTDGGSSGYDVYTFNIIKKDATPTWVVIANQVKGS